MLKVVFLALLLAAATVGNPASAEPTPVGSELNIPDAYLPKAANSATALLLPLLPHIRTGQVYLFGAMTPTGAGSVKPCSCMMSGPCFSRDWLSPR